MASRTDGEMMTLPAALFKSTTGVGVDFGGSLIKISYTKTNGNDVTFYNRLFTRENKDEAFVFLKELSSGLGADQELLTCGIGCNEFNDELKEIISRTPKNITELDAQVEAFRFLLRHRDVDQLVYPEEREIDDHMEAVKVAYGGITGLWAYETGNLQYADWVDRATGQVKPTAPTHESPRTAQYPFILYTAGSSGFAIKVWEDGRYQFLDFCPVSGRSMLAMGSMLVGANSFDEMVSMAEEGKETGVDVDFPNLAMNDSDPAYNALKKWDRTAFFLGQGVGKKLDDFGRGDVIRACMKMVAHVLALSAQSWAQQTHVKQVYFVGGTHKSELFRKMLYKEMAYRNGVHPTESLIDFMFVKECVYISSLGALLRGMVVQ